MIPSPILPQRFAALDDLHVARYPRLLLLGPITMEAAQGLPPQRAEKSCAEYCCWLLEHPGSTAVAMSQALLVAEGTRRSNMSRLRSWLGTSPDGQPYLPEAYSGRIRLHDCVTSDWELVRMLIHDGVEQTRTDALLDALSLVRGEPLADAAPGQWHWAQELRTDMVSVIRDIAVIVARRLLAEERREDARWAVNQGLVAAPGDEALICVKLEIAHAVGSTTEIDRLVGALIRDRRLEGVDLLPETVALIHRIAPHQTRLA